jgi:hypothetical protein
VKRLVKAAEDNALLVLLFGAAAAILYAGVTPFLVGSDFWLNLVAGREIVGSGLPSTDTLTVLTRGREWVDQQWLAHVTLYGLVRLGGLSLAAVFLVATILTAFAIATAAARRLGATQRATVIFAFLALIGAPWAFAFRAQALALPLFVAVVWLLVHARERIGPRTFLVIPLLVLWANVHGSVVVGATLAVWLAVVQLARRRGPVTPALLLAALGAGAVFATPYGPSATWRYYERTLINPPFEGLVYEWGRPTPNVLTAAFFILAGGTAILVVWQWRSLSAFELGALAITLGGALTSIRGVVWFVLLGLICAPRPLDGAARLSDAPIRPTFNRWLTAGVLAATVALAGSVFVRGSSWLESDWPTGALGPLRAATRGANERVWPTDRTSDWILWHVPDLRGRVAYDVRFELLSTGELEALARYNAESDSGWKSVTDGFDVIVVDPTARPSHVDDFRREPGTRLTYADKRAALLVRSRKN